MEASDCKLVHTVGNGVPVFAPRDPMGLDCPLGLCAKCDPLTRGKCDWKGYTDAGD